MKNVNLGKDRVGATARNKYGSLMEVIQYNNNLDILVKFEQGKPVRAQWYDFINGRIKNVYDKTVQGVGYIGEGEYLSRENGKLTPQYTTWQSMMMRCYSEKYKLKYPSYSNCTVYHEWHNYQNFAKWYDENFYQVAGETMCLDKDILIKGNKIYSPETCIFVPRKINLLFIRSELSKDNLPIGVYFNKVNKKYIARCQNNKGIDEYLGTFDTPEDAFYKYKSYREQLIKQIAEEYKERIPTRLYKAMLDFEIAITYKNK